MRQYLTMFLSKSKLLRKIFEPIVLCTYLRCCSMFVIVSFVFHCRLLFPHKNRFSKWFVLRSISFDLLAVSALHYFTSAKKEELRKNKSENFALSFLKRKDVRLKTTKKLKITEQNRANWEIWTEKVSPRRNRRSKGHLMAWQF